MEPYKLYLKVRDYECDLQGIVNNANYQHYLEHARHEFIRTIGLSFSGMHDQGIDFVVARIEMAFKKPLKSGDEFSVSVVMKKEGIRWVFYENIFREPDQVIAVKAKVDSVCLINGKLSDYKGLDEKFQEAFNDHE
ncbi:MAG: acyl-CoA thioesterase [Bacteroidota bacterium]|nr:acyl-CoA thioesterase [Bacteroidota bacterium]